MIQVTRLPEEVKRFLEPLRARFSYRHFLVFCWLIAAHLVCFEKATCKALGRYTPKHVGVDPTVVSPTAKWGKYQIPVACQAFTKSPFC
jgi:hypothetical protein